MAGDNAFSGPTSLDEAIIIGSAEEKPIMLNKNLFVFFTLLCIFLTLFGMLSEGELLAADGTPYNGPHNVPGIIQAEDFNSGPLKEAYYANTLGNSGGAYRTDTDVDIYNDGSNIYTLSTEKSIEDPPGSGHYGVYCWEFLKYTIEVGTAGWYKISYKAKYNKEGWGDISTSVDGFQRNYTNVFTQTTFTDVEGLKYIYLTAGTHILAVTFIHSGTCLDSISILSQTPPVFPSPQIVNSPQTTDEVVVANVVVTDSPFYADNTGITDCTAAIQNAINTAWEMGGGIVYMPPGKYRVEGTLWMSPGVTLRGDWKSPLEGGSGQGTILMAFSGKDNENAAGFIGTWEGCIRNLSIWYPDQHYSNGEIHKYPYTIVTYGCSYLLNLTLYNSYNGIDMRSGSFCDSDSGE